MKRESKGFSGSALRVLRFQVVGWVVIALLWISLVSLLLGSFWSLERVSLWVSIASLTTLYLFIVIWKNLKKNKREGEDQVLNTLGLGNGVTIFRGILIASLSGFLFSPLPPGIYAWLPGVIFILGSLPDYIDGIIARSRNQVTELGGILDINIDSLGVLTSSILVVQYGTIPWWYLPIGLARYLFIFGIQLREKLGLPVYDLPFSVRRRGFAALKMGFMFVMLFPLFGPPGTRYAALAFGLPFALAFWWDWLVAIGKKPPGLLNTLVDYGDSLLDRAPLFLRVLSVLLILPQIGSHLQRPEDLVLAYFEIGFTILIGLGAAPRISAIGAVVLLGVNQNLAPLTFIQTLLIFAYIGLIIFGGGMGSIWPVEERLVHSRSGDPHESGQ